MPNFDGTDHIFDSREVIARIEELEEILNDPDFYNDGDSDEQEEYDALLKLREEVEGTVADFPYGETFISDDYFEDYAEQLAYDIGAVDPEATWPLNRIDWAAAAEDLREDYYSFEFRGTTYWAR